MFLDAVEQNDAAQRQAFVIDIGVAIASVLGGPPKKGEESVVELHLSGLQRVASGEKENGDGQK